MKQLYLYYPILISHALLTAFMMFGWISNNRVVLYSLLLLLVTGLVLFLLLGGCFITRIEKRLSGRDFTVLDPIIKKIGITINRQSRVNITMIMFVVSLVITVYKLSKHG